MTTLVAGYGLAWVALVALLVVLLKRRRVQQLALDELERELERPDHAIPREKTR